MQRLAGWEQKFIEFIEAASQRPFSWGNHDCSMFARRGVEVITGVKTLADYCREDGTARYKTAKGALRLLKKQDEGSLLIATTRELGEPINPMFARRGDVALQHLKDELFFERMGVCVGGFAAFAHEPKGLSFVPLRETSHAWRVG